MLTAFCIAATEYFAFIATEIHVRKIPTHWRQRDADGGSHGDILGQLDIANV